MAVVFSMPRGIMMSDAGIRLPSANIEGHGPTRDATLRRHIFGTGRLHKREPLFDDTINVSAAFANIPKD